MEVDESLINGHLVQSERERLPQVIQVGLLAQSAHLSTQPFKGLLIVRQAAP
jgi:hypothetical protein